MAERGGTSPGDEPEDLESRVNALCETQREMQQTLVGHDAEFAAVRSEMAAGFATVGTGMAHMTNLLETLIERG
jgi:hypothetical protein